MKKELIQGVHRVRRTDQQETTPVTIPGTVYGALLDAGKMPDPFVGDHELEALALMEYEYEFTILFTPSPAFFQEQSQELVFDGLDTLAEVTLNGTPLGPWLWRIRNSGGPTDWEPNRSTKFWWCKG